MPSVVGAVLRPGGGNPAFQLCTFWVSSFSQEPSLYFAGLADHSTKHTGTWSFQTSPISTAELQELAPSQQLCTWLIPSKLVLVCINDPNKKYRIYGLRKKPTPMPARSYDLEISVNTSVISGAASLAIGDAGGYRSQALSRSYTGLHWYTEALLRGHLGRVELPRASISFSSDARIQVGGRSVVQLNTEQLLRSQVSALQSILNLPPVAERRPVLQQHATLSPHVAKIIVRDARTSNTSCPITFDEFKEITKFSVPVCGHVCAELARPLTQCPVCREATTWCNIEVPIEVA